MAIRTRATCLLAATLVAAVALATPSLHVEWQMQFSVTPYVILLDKGLVLTTAETRQGGGFLNTVQALNQSQEVVWTFTSFGQVSVPTTAAGFPSIPKLAFLLLNNLQPPNVTAIVPSTGEVVWSASAAFSTVSTASLQASSDGRTLYLFTESVYGQSQLTAFDATTGEILFMNEAVEPPVNVMRCGPSRKACLVECSQTGATVFWDGRSGALMRNTSLPIGTTPDWTPTYIPISEELLLLSNVGFLFAINTSNYTLAWSNVPWASQSYLPVYPRTQSYTAAKAKRLAVVAIGMSGIIGFDAATGAMLWNQSATTVCPFASPAPGLASSFSGDAYQVGAFPSEVGSGDLFSFAATCQYFSNSLTIVGSMSATNGAVKWWRYLTQYPRPYPLIPIGPKAFMLYSPSNQMEEFYDGSITQFGTFSPGGYAYNVLSLGNSTAIIQWSYYQYPRITALSVAWK